MKSAVVQRLSYRLQALTVTRRTYHEHRESRRSYRELVKTIKIDFKTILKQGYLAALGIGAIINIHLQDNVHIHALYWGPEIDQNELSASWYSITRDSSHVDVKYPVDENDIEAWFWYMNKLHQIDPRDLIFYWEATRRMRLASSYGYFYR